MAVVVKFNKSMDHMLRGPGGAVDRDMRRRALLVQGGARAQVGKRTGALGASIHTRRSRDAIGPYWAVGSNMNYALIHHEGSPPHMIVPNRKQVLRFTAGTRVVYTRSVAHPGFRANRYLKDNLYLALL